MMMVNPEPYMTLNTNLGKIIDASNELVRRRSNSEEEIEAGSN